MPHFVLHCIDGPEAAELRPIHRPAHLDHVRGSGMVRVAGRLTDEAGAVIGSLLIVEAQGIDDARSFSREDPFTRVGVYKSVEISPFLMSHVDMPDQAGQG